jgi:hypothetical protein
MVGLKSQALARAVLREEVTIAEARSQLSTDIEQHCDRGLVRPAAQGCFPPAEICPYAPVVIHN